MVAHLPGDPSRVRPVDGWSPGYQRLVGYALLLVPAGALLSGLGVLSRRRGSRFEGDRPLPTAPQDAGLGRRVVRGSPLVHALSVAPLAAVGLVTLGLSTLTSRPGPIALVGGLLLVVAAALSAFMWWNHGRDGVWSTPTHLVARRRSHLRRWPWEQVHELGFVVQKGQALVASARVDDGLDDGIGADEWVTLARPLLGPLSAHEFARRARALAEERGLPLAEDVHRLDLADTGLGRLARRGPGSWARR